MTTEATVEQIFRFMEAEDELVTRPFAGNNTHEGWDDIDLRLRAQLEGLAGQVIAAGPLALELGITEAYLRQLLSSHPLVHTLIGKNCSCQYRVLGVPLEASEAGLQEIEDNGSIFDLGHQARADFYELINERSRNNRRRKRMVIQRF